MARRVSSAGVVVEQKSDVNNRRVSSAGVMVEQKTVPNWRRVSSAGIMVEWEEMNSLAPTGIASEEAFGSATVTPGPVEILPQGTASTEAFGTALITIGVPNFTLYPTGIASIGSFGTPTLTLINYSNFHQYIVLDGKQYRTVHKSWVPEVMRPMMSRELLNGNLDATFGASSMLVWEGEIVAPISVDDSDWGTIADLRTTLKKKVAVAFADHYGSTYAVVNLFGPFPERSPSPVWDGTGNTLYVKIKIKAKA